MKFKSKYSPDKLVTAAQYITELICEKKARLNGKGDLPIFFWRLEEWKKFYKNQIFAAYGLLKIYEADAIIKAIKSKDAYFQYSLRSKKLDAIIEREQQNIDKIKENIDNINTEIRSENDVVEQPRSPYSGKSNELNKLRNL